MAGNQEGAHDDPCEVRLQEALVARRGGRRPGGRRENAKVIAGGQSLLRCSGLGSPPVGPRRRAAGSMSCAASGPRLLMKQGRLKRIQS